MAAVTVGVVAGAGALMSYYGAQQAGKANQRAMNLNAADAERNAKLAREKAIEDERMFRLSFNRDQGANVAAIGASGIKMEGSPLEVLRDNAANAESDALRIRKGGEIEAESFRRQARNLRQGGRAARQAGDIGAAAGLLQGSVQGYSAYKQAGG